MHLMLSRLSMSN